MFHPRALRILVLAALTAACNTDETPEAAEGEGSTETLAKAEKPEDGLRRSKAERGKHAQGGEIDAAALEAAKIAPADVAAPPADAQTTASGLAYKALTEAPGDQHPRAHDGVEVVYTGWTTDGEMFDSSLKRGKPASFPLNRVIAGWTEGLQLMTAGDKYRFWIPESLAYKGQPGRPAGMLVFDVELVSIDKQPDPPAVPSDVAGPPADAKKTASGLAYKVLTAGTGADHPKAESEVTVHYSGWTTDGQMFDSSVLRGEPASFPLNRVIAGWTEGLQLMTTGAKYRFWIPVDLAYQNRPGKPAGMLVFDVELLGIK